jgi:hypothetical protein
MVRKSRRSVAAGLTPEELVDIWLRLNIRERGEAFRIPKEVGVVIGKDETTVRQLVREGAFAGLKVGGRVHIYMPSVVEWMKATAATF